MKLICFLLLGVMIPVYGKVFETQVEQTSPQEGDFGEYRLWLPPDAHPNRILVVVWGGNQCSLGIVDDPVWQQLAQSINCALMAGFFYPQTSDNHWDRADEGSGEALLKAIMVLAQTSSESQLASAPLYLVGDSQGGQFAFSFASWQPTRTLGFVSLKGGYHDLAEVQSAARVPGLFFLGESDAAFRLANIKDVFSKGRALGAPWCLAVEPHGNHTPDLCGPLVRSYLKALARTLSQGVNTSNETSVKPKDRLTTEDISSLSWFADAAFKRDWSTFGSGMLKVLPSPLDFKSMMPPALGTVTPISEEMGSIDSRQKSPEFSLKVMQNGESKWDDVSILDCPYLADEKAVKLSQGCFKVNASLNSSDLPLGRFTGVIPLRFKSGGQSMLGGLNVPLIARVIGDVAANPPLIFLVVQTNSIATAHIRITSKTKQSVHLLSVEAFPGIKIKASAASEGRLELTVSFDFQNERPCDLAPGSLLLHLKTDKEWLLRVPYIASPQ